MVGSLLYGLFALLRVLTEEPTTEVGQHHEFCLLACLPRRNQISSRHSSRAEI